MNQARKRATDMALSFIQDLSPGENVELTKKRLESLSDQEFDLLMVKFSKGEDYLQTFHPVGDKETRLDMDHLHDVANKYKISFYKRVWMPNEDGSWELSNKNSMVMYLPVRIQQQLVTKKISIPKDNRHIDYFSKQATGPETKGARMSYPEVNTMLAMGLTNTVEEMMHFRGGAENGVRVLETSIMQIGRASADVLRQYSGTVGANHMLHSYLTAMMLKSTLLAK